MLLTVCTFCHIYSWQLLCSRVIPVTRVQLLYRHVSNATVVITYRESSPAVKVRCKSSASSDGGAIAVLNGYQFGAFVRESGDFVALVDMKRLLRRECSERRAVVSKYTPQEWPKGRQAKYRKSAAKFWAQRHCYLLLRCKITTNKKVSF